MTPTIPPTDKALPRSLWALMMGNFVIGTGVMVVPGTLNDISASLNVSIPQAGQLITAAAILMAQHAPGQEEAAFLKLLGMRKHGWPNTRMVEFADELLKRGASVLLVDRDAAALARAATRLAVYGERVGTLTAQARQDSEATGAILKQATDNRDSLSAVNLDEEAANLIKFEQYYNASAQVIQVARSLFDTLISTFR